MARMDRFDYIRINTDEIASDGKSAFRLAVTTNRDQNFTHHDSMGIKYDYGSAMHYGGRVRDISKLYLREKINEPFHFENASNVTHDQDNITAFFLF